MDRRNAEHLVERTAVALMVGAASWAVAHTEHGHNPLHIDHALSFSVLFVSVLLAEAMGFRRPGMHVIKRIASALILGGTSWWIAHWEHGHVPTDLDHLPGFGVMTGSILFAQAPGWPRTALTGVIVSFLSAVMAMSRIPQPEGSDGNVPHAPPIEPRQQQELWEERLMQFSLEPGERREAVAQELWKAPVGTPASCATASVLFTWMVRDPYPGSVDLEVRTPIPMGGGRTEQIGVGRRGLGEMSWCGKVMFQNNDLRRLWVEVRYASVLAR
jgi:hypothetical protein